MDEQVVVIRDRLGIPHVKARTAHDAFFAQGFVHAQDRLWQMEFDRRRAAGRTAELVGRKGVTYDIFTRRMGLEAAARADYETLDASSRAPLDAYSAGVNAFIESTEALPVEMTLLGIESPDWEPWHCAAVLKARHVLMGSMGPKLWRARVLRALGPDVTRIFGAPDGREDLLIIPTGAHEVWTAAPGELDAPLLAGDAMGDGSNNWAVHGSRTASGLPLLAGDPHRTIEMPNVYYQNHIVCDAFDAIGFSMPGVPGMFHFGHNATVAWCITHAMADTKDLYVERFAEDGSYEHGSERLQPRRRTETIAVRSDDDIQVEVIETVNGSVAFGDPARGIGIAVRWTGSDRPNDALSVIEPMLRATTVDELEETMRPWVDPCNSFLSADVHGTISYLHRGRIPVRDRANAWAPVPGWTGAHDWTGDVPFEELPRLRDPEEGLIVTANNRVIGSAYPYHLAIDYAAPYRARRVLDRLRALPKATIEDMAAVHADRLSLSSKALIDVVARITPGDEAIARARDVLLDWNGEMETDAVAPLVFARTREELSLLLLEREPLARLRDNPFREEPYATSAGSRVRSALPRLMASGNTAITNGDPWEQVVLTALERAVMSLRKTYGDDESEWTWGRAHVTVSRHMLSSVFPEHAGSLDPPSLPVGGDGDTVQAGSNDSGHTVLHSSVARYAFDLSDWERSAWIVPHGSSGHPASPHYADQAEAWASVRMFPMTYAWDRIEQVAETRQTLAPR